MYKAIFVLVPSFCNDFWLDRKMMQITENMVSVLNLKDYPVVYANDYNEINQYLNKAEFIIVITAGNIFLHRDKLWEKINQIDCNIGILGHILQFEYDDTPYLHEQFFIINTKAISSVNLKSTTVYSFGPCIDRSKQDLHEGHSPLYVKLSNRYKTRKMQFGSNLIEQALQNGFEVRNFDEEWRNPQIDNDHYLGRKNLPLRGYCYPKKNTEIFSKSLRELKIYPGLDEAQEIFLQLVLKALEYNVLNVWHYDFVPECIRNFDHVLAPATGFLAEQIALRTNAKKITFYDINKNNLDFKKELYRCWNGKDYENFYQSWAERHNLIIEPNHGEDLRLALENRKETENTIFEDWSNFKSRIEIEFVHADLIGNDRIINAITNNSLIFTSTILNVYTFTSIVHEQSDIEKTKAKLQSTVDKKKSVWIEV